MKKFLLSNLLIISGILAGAATGFLYWKFYGCTHGCAIKSNPYLMTLYGMLMGGLLFSFFKTKKQ